jgi:hypothetical protein
MVYLPWGLNISLMQATPDLSWTPAKPLELLEAFTAGFGGFGTARVAVSFVAAAILWSIMLTTMVQALRTLHRLAWLRALPAFAAGWLAYLAFIVFFYAPLIGMVYQAFGLPRPR